MTVLNILGAVLFGIGVISSPLHGHSLALISVYVKKEYPLSMLNKYLGSALYIKKRKLIDSFKNSEIKDERLERYFLYFKITRYISILGLVGGSALFILPNILR